MVFPFHCLARAALRCRAESVGHPGTSTAPFSGAVTPFTLCIRFAAPFSSACSGGSSTVVWAQHAYAPWHIMGPVLSFALPLLLPVGPFQTNPPRASGPRGGGTSAPYYPQAQELNGRQVWGISHGAGQ